VKSRTPPRSKLPKRVQECVEHYDCALPVATSSWFESLEAAREGVRFSIRSTWPTEQSAGLSGREKRQREFLLGRRCASQLLIEQGVFQPVEVNQDRSPAWPDGMAGSISHSDGWTIAAVASAEVASSLGVDTEPFMLSETAQLIASDVATADEIELVKAQGLDATSALTLIFSAKESFYKCWYPVTKQFLEFHDVAVVSMTDACLVLRKVGESTTGESDLTVHYHLSDDDVFTFAVLEGQQ